MATVHSFVKLDEHVAELDALRAKHAEALEELYGWLMRNISNHGHMAPEHVRGYVAAMNDVVRYVRKMQ